MTGKDASKYIKTDNMKDVKAATKLLTQSSVYVGVPDTGADRGNSDPINNAALAYIHDNGAPAANIPARPFMRPGIENAKDAIDAQFQRAAKAAYNGDAQGVSNGLNGAGLAAQSSIKKKIVEGPFAPLAAATLAQRQAKGFKGTKPLIVTGKLLNSITYVVRKS